VLVLNGASKSAHSNLKIFNFLTRNGAAYPQEYPAQTIINSCVGRTGHSSLVTVRPKTEFDQQYFIPKHTILQGCKKGHCAAVSKKLELRLEQSLDWDQLSKWRH
jgi:hypothetical protein